MQGVFPADVLLGPMGLSSEVLVVAAARGSPEQEEWCGA
jgi:hypothetical protein